MIKKLCKKTIGLILAAAMMLSAAGCGTTDKAASNTQAASNTSAAQESLVKYADKENEEFEKFIQDKFVEDMSSDTPTYNQNFKDGSAFGVERPEAKWAVLPEGKDIPEKIENEKKKLDDEYAKLMSFEGADLTEEEYFIFLTLKSDYEMALKSYEYILFSEPMGPSRGIQANAGVALVEYSFRQKQDIDDYLVLEETFPELIQYYVDLNAWRAEQGYALQDVKADTVIGQCDLFLADKENNYVVVDFNNKIDACDFLSEAEKKEYKEKNKKSVEGLFKGYEMIRDSVKANKGKSMTQGGLCEYTNGKDYINEYIIPYNSGNKKTAEEVIEGFDKRVVEIQNEMTLIAQSSPEVYQDFMANNYSYIAKYDNMDLNQLVDELQEKTLSDYPELPEKLKYNATIMSDVQSQIMPTTIAYYCHPAYDELDKNVMKGNALAPQQRWFFFSHEGCPGHMYQFNYFMSTNPKNIRKAAHNLGYMEGWAVYVMYDVYKYCDFDNVADEDKETVAKLFALNGEFNYIIQNRVDLGINYEGWKVEDLQAYLNKIGTPIDAQNLYDAFSTMDCGVILSYGQGYNEMMDIHKYAEKKLGPNYDVKEFNKVILEAGPCYYWDLKFKVDEYIAEHK